MDKVKVKVTGLQADFSGEETKIEMMAEGRHYYKAGRHYIFYEDGLDEAQSITTVLKIEEASFSISRHGQVEHEQYFAPHEESNGIYKTPYGDIPLTVRTDSLAIAFAAISGNIDVAYALSSEGKPLGANKLHIEIIAAGETADHKFN